MQAGKMLQVESLNWADNLYGNEADAYKHQRSYLDTRLSHVSQTANQKIHILPVYNFLWRKENSHLVKLLWMWLLFLIIILFVRVHLALLLLLPCQWCVKELSLITSYKPKPGHTTVDCWLSCRRKVTIQRVKKK